MGSYKNEEDKRLGRLCEQRTHLSISQGSLCSHSFQFPVCHLNLIWNERIGGDGKEEDKKLRRLMYLPFFPLLFYLLNVSSVFFSYLQRVWEIGENITYLHPDNPLQKIFSRAPV